MQMILINQALKLFSQPPYTIIGGGDQGSGSSSNQIEVNFLVHSSQVGGIIGRAGTNIKQLREVYIPIFRIHVKLEF